MSALLELRAESERTLCDVRANGTDLRTLERTLGLKAVELVCVHVGEHPLLRLLGVNICVDGLSCHQGILSCQRDLEGH